MKKIFGFVIIMLLTIILGGCVPENNDGMIKVIDMSGEEVYVPKNPKKVAAVSPSTGDLMVAFGLGDILDGTYYSVTNNPWVDEIYPESKDFYGYDYDLSVESFIERGVDLIFIPEPETAKNLRNHGLNALCIRQFAETGYGDYVFYFSNILKQIWGDKVSEKVDMWQLEFTTAINSVKDVLSKQANLERRTLYYVCGDKDRGLGYTDLGKSLLEYVYDQLNIDFVCNRFETNKPSAEAVLEINPDIVVIGGIYQQYLLQQIEIQEPWNQLKAVKDKQVFNIPVAFVSFEQTCAESALFVYDMANKLYPDLFNYDIKTLTKECIEKYFGYTLTDNDVENMLNGLDKNGEPLIWKE